MSRSLGTAWFFDWISCIYRKDKSPCVYYSQFQSNDMVRFRVMVFNATYIMAVSFIGGGNRRQASDKRYHIMLHRVHLAWAGFELTILMVIGTDCIGSTTIRSRSRRSLKAIMQIMTNRTSSEYKSQKMGLKKLPKCLLS
jgi:Na+/pantothenate symporter